MAQDGYIPQLGDIGLVRITGAGGFLIRVAQWLNGDGFADLEHAFVAVGDGELVEAEPGGARVRPLSQYGGMGVVWLRCPPQYGPAVAAAARAMNGVGYSWLDYIALAAHRLHVPVPGLKTYIGSTGHEMCSALADEAASQGGWELFDDQRWEGYVTPGALRRLAFTQAATQ